MGAKWRDYESLHQDPSRTLVAALTDAAADSGVCDYGGDDRRRVMKVLINDKLLDLTPEILAEQFAGMDSSEQARFFNHVSAVSSVWARSFPFQLQYITDEDGLTLEGRRVMQYIGEYSHWGLVP